MYRTLQPRKSARGARQPGKHLIFSPGTSPSWKIARKAKENGKKRCKLQIKENQQGQFLHLEAVALCSGARLCWALCSLVGGGH